MTRTSALYSRLKPDLSLQRSCTHCQVFLVSSCLWIQPFWENKQCHVLPRCSVSLQQDGSCSLEVASFYLALLQPSQLVRGLAWLHFPLNSGQWSKSQSAASSFLPSCQPYSWTLISSPISFHFFDLLSIGLKSILSILRNDSRQESKSLAHYLQMSCLSCYFPLLT